MRQLYIWIMAVIAMTVVACSGGDTGSGRAEGNEVEAGSDEEVDNCTLITADEATTLAGYELEQGEDSILGCGYLPPGASVADVVVRTALVEGDARSVAEDGFPDAEQILDVAMGDDTVAVTTPAGDSIASVITGRNGRFVELSIVFLLVDPADQPKIDEAAALAVTALERWQGG